jgi:hypothetical protein
VTRAEIQSSSGRVSPGWRRWVRARDAAYARPLAPDSVRFRKRRSNADIFNFTAVDVYSVRRGTRKVCSRFCLAMQLQLDAGSTDWDTLVNNVDACTEVKPDEVTRGFTCFVCARRIFEGGWADPNSFRVDFWDKNQQVPAQVRKPRSRPEKKPVVALADTPSPARKYFGASVTAAEYTFLLESLEVFRHAAKEIVK